MDTTSGLKVGRRDISGPTVCDGVPGSRWPVIESEEDVSVIFMGVSQTLGAHRLIHVYHIMYAAQCSPSVWLTPMKPQLDNTYNTVKYVVP